MTEFPVTKDEWLALSDEGRQKLLDLGFDPPWALIDNQVSYPAAPPQVEGTTIKKSL